MPLYILRPKGAFHVGQDVGKEQQKVYPYVPSDTLFAAFMSAWAQLGQADAVAGQFQSAPPFTLTSAFPCLLAQAEPLRATVRFLPLPLVKLPDDRVLPPKDKKSLQWVSAGVFEKLCAAQALDGEVSDEKNFSKGKAVWLLLQERKEALQAGALWSQEAVLWSKDVVPHVTVDRVTNASNLFHTGRVILARDVGLWFAMRGDAAAQTLIEQALSVLADAGLGGLRSTGHGAFVWRKDETELPLPPTGGGHAVTLARYAPKDAAEIARALQPPGASYQLVNVAGWCDDDARHPWRRRRVRLVDQGSVIGCAGGDLGHLVDVTPENASQAHFNGRKVYRYGYAFPVRVSRDALREAPDA